MDRLSYREGAAYAYPVKPGGQIYENTLAVLDETGHLIPAGAAGGVVFAGIAASRAASGLVSCQRGRAYPLTFDQPPSYADIGKAVYARDATTVSLTGTGRIRIGVLDGIEQGTPWVRI